MKIVLKNIGAHLTTACASSSRPIMAAVVKTCFACPLLAAAALLSGCAGSQPKLVLAPVGPPPARLAGISATNGSLMVFSACEAVPDLSAENSGSTADHWEYSGYKIFSADGQLFKSVQNNAGTVLLHPQQVELPAGRYRVVAEANAYGRVAVPVVITGGRVTVLHLDGEGFWPREHGFNETNTVQLPDGQIVGWRAIAENTRMP